MGPQKGVVSLGVPREALQAAFDEVAGSGYLSEGKFVHKLEEAVAKRYNCYAVAMSGCGSCLYTVARWLSDQALIQKDKVIVPNNTFYATGAMFQEAGYRLLLADCNKEDFSLSKHEVVRLIESHGSFLGAVVLTHVGGGLADDYADIAEVCKRANIPLVEDAAHAFGAERFYTGSFAYGRHVAGDLGLAACFSLYATKAIPVGEGGVMVTKNKALFEFARQFRNYGKYVDHDGKLRYGKGFNFQLDEWSAAVAYLQVQRIDEILALRSEDAARLSKIATPLVSQWHGGNWYKFITMKEPFFKRKAGQVYAQSDQLISALPAHGYTQDEFPNCQWVSEMHECLPIGEGMYRGMSTDDIRSWLGSAK